MDSIAEQFDAAEPEGSSLSRPRELDLELDPPILFEKKPFKTLHLKEPTAFQVQRAEFEIAGGSNFYTLRKYQIAMIAYVSGTPVEVVQKIRISELMEAWKFIEPFTPLFRLTGESLWPTSRAGGDGDRETPGA